MHINYFGINKDGGRCDDSLRKRDVEQNNLRTTVLEHTANKYCGFRVMQLYKIPRNPEDNIKGLRANNHVFLYTKPHAGL